MNTTADNKKKIESDPKAHRELLLKVYDAAIHEYRFNVQLSWDRTKFFLVLSSGLIAAGVGLLKVADPTALNSAFLVAFFIVSILITASGLETIAVGKIYYRRATFTKTIVERELGLLDPIPGLDSPHANLSIAVTDGQRDHRAILFSDEKAKIQSEKRIGIGTIASNIRAIFWMMIIIEFCGASVAVFNMMEK